MTFAYTSRIYDVLCAFTECGSTDAFDARIVDAARRMIADHGSVESALRYCCCLMD
jgi:hypothetical protein